MKTCPNCNGRGVEHIGTGVLCVNCHGTGIVEKTEQTNEEWLRQCTTEEAAKEIYKIAKDDFKELRKLFYRIADDDCDAIALWLKQPHKE